MSDSEQTLSDSDQTRSDSDQTLSDREQQASDDDQAASDLGRSQGGDRAAHERSSAIRAGATKERIEVGLLREETAAQRDAAAKRRDDLAAARDREAEIADRRALELEAGAAISDGQALRAQEMRERALAGRERASAARERATRNREEAARDRALAAHDREQARLDRVSAGTDDLTGARRRGVGLEELTREIDRARRTGHSLVAAYVDVDNLKVVNDEDGHGAGDEVLRKVVKSLRHHMRSYDLVVRLGGDEFLCILPDVNSEEAIRRFGDLDSELSAGTTAVSVSIGLSELRDGETALELINRADKDLLARRKT